jgi:hypothetical protein
MGNENKKKRRLDKEKMIQACGAFSWVWKELR